MVQSNIINNKEKLAAIEQALLATYFRDNEKDFLKSEQGRTDIDANVFTRYNTALNTIVPWVAKVCDLKEKDIVEIGCGTGSSSAAFSHYVKKISGYDIDEKSIGGAKARMEIMQRNNVDLCLVTPDNLIDKLKEDHPKGADIILLYAVLEHQTIKERHETIKGCWDLLKKGGLLVVTDTPNLLCYHDYHTSLLPFIHMLPTELYGLYASCSPREDFNSDFSKPEDVGAEELERKISRWGRGVSYHDFELSLGADYGNYLVCSGFEPEILDHIDVSPEEELLSMYIERCGLKIPQAFSRVVLNFILQKPPVSQVKAATIPENKCFVPVEKTIELVAQNNLLSNTLLEMESSLRWKLGCFIAAPYRRLKKLARKYKL